MNPISPSALKEKLQNGADEFLLIDVREQAEHNNFNIGGVCIPLPDIISEIAPFLIGKPIVFYCSMGIRSAIAIQRLEEKYPGHNFINLTDGLVEWRKCFPDSQS